MRQILLFSLLFIGLTPMFSQVISDDITSTRILDKLVFKGNTYTFKASGPCQIGTLLKNGEKIAYCGTSNSAKFKVIDNKWYLGVNTFAADDIQFEIINVFYLDDESIKKVTSETPPYYGGNTYKFSDFTVIDNDFAFIDARNNLGYNMSLTDDGDVNPISENTVFKYLTKYGDKLINISEESGEIIELDGSFDEKNSTETDAKILDYKIYNNILYLRSTDNIITMTPEMEQSTVAQLPNTGIIVKDMIVDNNGIYVIGSEGESSIVYHHSDSGWIEVFRNDLDYLTLERFTRGDASQIFGEHQFGSGSTSVEVKTDTPFSPNDMASISIVEITQEIEPLDTITTPFDTIYLNRYYNQMSFDIFNESADTIQSVLISSRFLDGINCAQLRYEKKFNNLSLAPGDSFSIDTLFSSYTKPLGNFCLNIVSVNDSLDTAIENNRSCYTVVSTKDEPSIRTCNSFYPTVTSGILRNDATFKAQTIDIYNQAGQNVSRQANISTDVIDLGNLPSGVYYLLARYDDGVCREMVVKE